jgi:hypothetical protein
MEIDYDIWSNFCIVHFDQRSMNLKLKLNSDMDFELKGI